MSFQYFIGTPVLASGVAVDFAIPAGVALIVAMWRGVSTNGINPYLVRLGDAGGIEVAGYVDASGDSVGQGGSLTGFQMHTAAVAAGLYSGTMLLGLANPATFTWVVQNALNLSTGNVATGGGGKSLSAELTTVRFTSLNDVDTFDAGQFNVAWLIP